MDPIFARYDNVGNQILDPRSIVFLGTFAWAQRPSPSGVPAGSEIIINDYPPNGGKTRWYSDGTNWNLFNGSVLHSTFTQVVGIASATNQLLAVSPALPRSLLASLRWLEFSLVGSKNGTTDAMAINVYVGPTGTSADTAMAGVSVGTWTAAFRQFNFGALLKYNAATSKVQSLATNGQAMVAISGSSLAYPSLQSAVLADVNQFVSVYIQPAGATDIPALERFQLMGW